MQHLFRTHLQNVLQQSADEERGSFITPKSSTELHASFKEVSRVLDAALDNHNVSSLMNLSSASKNNYKTSPRLAKDTASTMASVQELTIDTSDGCSNQAISNLIKSARSNSKNLSRFHSRAASIELKSPGLRTSIASIMSPGTSLSELGREVSSLDLNSFKRKTDTIVAELIKVITYQANCLEKASENKESTEERASTMRNIIQIIESITEDYSNSDWQSRLENLQDELKKVSNHSDNLIEQIKASEKAIRKEYQTQLEDIKIRYAEFGPLTNTNSELLNLLDSNRKRFDQVQREKMNLEQQVRDEKVELKRRDDETKIWRNKVQKVTYESKLKDRELKNSLEQFAKLNTNLESKIRENLLLIQNHRNEKEQLEAKNSSEMLILQSKISNLMVKTDVVDELRGKSLEHESQIDKLQEELQACQERLEVSHSNRMIDNKNNERKIKQLQMKYDSMVADHKLYCVHKDRELAVEKCKFQQAKDLLATKDKQIRYLSADSDIFKKRIKELTVEYCQTENEFPTINKEFNELSNSCTKINEC